MKGQQHGAWRPANAGRRGGPSRIVAEIDDIVG